MRVFLYSLLLVVFFLSVGVLGAEGIEGVEDGDKIVVVCGDGFGGHFWHGDVEIRYEQGMQVEKREFLQGSVPSTIYYVGNAEGSWCSVGFLDTRGISEGMRNQSDYVMVKAYSEGFIVGWGGGVRESRSVACGSVEWEGLEIDAEFGLLVTKFLFCGRRYQGGMLVKMEERG